MTSVEKFTETVALANRLMDEYGLIEEGWTFDFDRGKHRVGCCHYKTKKITFSAHYVEQTEMKEIEDVIRHEIAHALAGFKAAHNYMWRAWAVKVGARPETCVTNAKATIKHNYIIECSACGQRWKRLRLQRKLMKEGVESVCCKAQLKFYKVK